MKYELTCSFYGCGSQEIETESKYEDLCLVSENTSFWFDDDGDPRCECGGPASIDLVEE